MYNAYPVLTFCLFISHCISGAGFESIDWHVTFTVSPILYVVAIPKMRGSLMGGTEKKLRFKNSSRCDYFNFNNVINSNCIQLTYNCDVFTNI